MQQSAAHLMFDWSKASFEEAEAEIRSWGDRWGKGVDVIPTKPLAYLTIEYTGADFYRLIPLVESNQIEDKAAFC